MILFGILIFFSPALIPGDQGYPLMICGGEPIEVNIGVSPRTFNVTILNCKKSSYAATQKTPQPGEIAWMDRPLSKTEPARLKYSIPFGSESGDFRIAFSGEKVVGLYIKENSLKSFLHAMLEKKTFVVYCRNVENDHLEILRIGL